MSGWNGGIAMFLFWILIIGGIALLVVGLTRPKAGLPPAQRDESPLEILKWRYAAGEIDRDEYERMKELLLS
ncbi:MAG TPA: SHOCT domain-containing protein [Anaerolineae bacterium]|nr:SHOCT domain-containing protein [Anaerolineae bacterium]